MKTNKEKALNWVNTYFSQEEEYIYSNLEVEVKNKNISKIISLSHSLNSLKERKAYMIETIEDASDLSELVAHIFDNVDISREMELDYIKYIFDVQD